MSEDLITSALQKIQLCNKDDSASKSAARTDFWELGRAVKMMAQCPNAIEKCFESAIKKAQITDSDTREDVYAAFMLGLLHAKFPPQALAEIAQTTKAFTKSWGEIDAPRWCIIGAKEKYPRLYLAVCILGANGRIFPFAQCAVGTAFGFNSATVRNFINLALGYKIIEVVRHGTSRNPMLLARNQTGVKLGKPSYYRLCPEVRDKNFERIAKKGDAISFREYLRRTMPWALGNAHQATTEN